MYNKATHAARAHQRCMHRYERHRLSSIPLAVEGRQLRAGRVPTERQMTAAPSENLTILTFASSNYLHWLNHLYVNVHQLRLKEASLLVCSADDVSLSAAQRKGLATLDVRDTAGCSLCSLLRTNWTSEIDAETGEIPCEDEGETWGTSTYTRIVHSKSLCVHMHVERHGHGQGLLLFVDTDVTLFSDPRPYLERDMDIALQLDIGPGFVNEPECGRFNASGSNGSYLNSGLFLMRHTHATRQLWRQMLRYHADNPSVLQQAALNTLLRDGANIKLHGLDPRRFLSGWCFYEQLPEHVHTTSQSLLSTAPGLLPDSVVAVHHNWIKGDRQKWLRAVQAGAVAVDDTPDFINRARTAMKALVQWTPYAQSVRRRCATLPLTPPAFGGVCRRGRDSAPRLCVDHNPVALWSFPGSGSTWLRLVIELATGAVRTALPTLTSQDRLLADPLLSPRAVTEDGLH